MAKSKPQFDKALLVKLLESRILAVSIVGGFVLTNLSLVRSPTESSTLMIHYPIVGTIPLTVALGLQSVITLTLLLIFGVMDLATMHWLAFNKENWAISAYRFNTVFSPVPFVLGGGNVMMLSITRALPLGIADAILLRTTNPLLTLSLAMFISGLLMVEGGIRSYRDIVPLALAVVPYVVYIVAVLRTP